MVGLPMVENCLSGYNSCMFAYGQVFQSCGLLIFFNSITEDRQGEIHFYCMYKHVGKDI